MKMTKRRNEIELLAEVLAAELEPPPIWATSGVSLKSSLARNIFSKFYLYDIFHYTRVQTKK